MGDNRAFTAQILLQMVYITIQILPVLIVRYCNPIKKQNPDFHIDFAIPIMLAHKKKQFRITKALSLVIIPIIAQTVDPKMNKPYPKM